MFRVNLSRFFSLASTATGSTRFQSTGPLISAKITNFAADPFDEHKKVKPFILARREKKEGDVPFGVVLHSKKMEMELKKKVLELEIAIQYERIKDKFTIFIRTRASRVKLYSGEARFIIDHLDRAISELNNEGYSEHSESVFMMRTKRGFLKLTTVDRQRGLVYLAPAVLPEVKKCLIDVMGVYDALMKEIESL